MFFDTLQYLPVGMGPGLSSSTKLSKDFWRTGRSQLCLQLLGTIPEITFPFSIRKAAFLACVSHFHYCSFSHWLAMATEDQHPNIFSLRNSISEQVMAKDLLSEVFFSVTVQRILIMDETNCLTHKTIPNGWGKTRLQEYFIGFGVSLPLHKK